jgi:hypothetical protein
VNEHNQTPRPRPNTGNLRQAGDIIFTIGHSTRTLAEFVALLRQVGRHAARGRAFDPTLADNAAVQQGEAARCARRRGDRWSSTSWTGSGRPGDPHARCARPGRGDAALSSGSGPRGERRRRLSNRSSTATSLMSAAFDANTSVTRPFFARRARSSSTVLAGDARSSLVYRRRNSGHLAGSWPYHSRSPREGAMSFSHASRRALAFDTPRGVPWLSTRLVARAGRSSRGSRPMQRPARRLAW